MRFHPSTIVDAYPEIFPVELRCGVVTAADMATSCGSVELECSGGTCGLIFRVGRKIDVALVDCTIADGIDPERLRPAAKAANHEHLLNRLLGIPVPAAE